MHVPFSKPLLGEEERAAVIEVLKGRVLTNGGQVRAFEEAFQEYVGGGMAVAVSSCTAALHLACLAIGVGPGDEVIVPALTHVATAHAVELTGASCRFCDSHPESGNLDPDFLESLINLKTKAIIVVHFLGRPGYMRSILAVARAHNLKVIEDCAHALGARHNDVHVGLVGDVGCFSFYPCKHITTGEGGMLLTRHPEIGEAAREMREFGKREYPVTGHQPLWKKIHGYDFARIGLNYRMTEIAGALGLNQLRRASSWRFARQLNYQTMLIVLGEVGLTALDSIGEQQHPSYYAISALVQASIRDDLRRRLYDRLVETSIYYQRPVPFWDCYQQKYKMKEGTLPVAERLAQESITFSVGPHLKKKHLAHVAEMLRQYVPELKIHGGLKVA